MSGASTRLPRTASWKLIDQVLSALSNIVLSIVVARSVSAADFGAFAVAFVVFGIGIAGTKSVVGQPLQIKFSAAAAHEQGAAIAVALGCALAIGLSGTLVVTSAGLLVGGAVGAALVALAVVLPGLLLQDSCRTVAFAVGRPRLAAAIGALWALEQFALVAVLLFAGLGTVPALVLAWGVAAALSALPGLIGLGVRPRLTGAAGWLRDHRKLIRYRLPEYLLSVGAMQFGILLVGLIASPSAVSSLRAAQVLLGALSLLGAAVFQFVASHRRASVSA